MQTVMYLQKQLTFQEVNKISYQPMLMAHDFYSAILDQFTNETIDILELKTILGSKLCLKNTPQKSEYFEVILAI